MPLSETLHWPLDKINLMAEAVMRNQASKEIPTINAAINICVAFCGFADEKSGKKAADQIYKYINHLKKQAGYANTNHQRMNRLPNIPGAQKVSQAEMQRQLRETQRKMEET